MIDRMIGFGVFKDEKNFISEDTAFFLPRCADTEHLRWIRRNYAGPLLFPKTVVTRSLGVGSANQRCRKIFGPWFPTNLRNIRQTIVKLSELIIVYPCLSNRSQTAISLHFLQYPARAVLLTITGGTVEKTQPQSVACIALFARLHATEIGPVILESSFWYRSKRSSCFIRSSSEYACMDGLVE